MDATPLDELKEVKEEKGGLLAEVFEMVEIEDVGPGSELVDGGEITCRSCGQVKFPHKNNRHMCVDCVKVENSRVSHRRKHNEGWMAEAKMAELEYWARQPRETDREWQIWLCYRDQYPSKRPTFVDVAEQLNTTVSNVRSVGYRWDFSVRMQAWAQTVDRLTMEKRQTEIMDMNEKHVAMAQRLNEKLAKVIELIEPDEVTPTQLSTLMKVATDLERKANIGVLDSGGKLRDLRDTAMGKEVGIKEHTAKKEDLQQVVDILAKAGVLGAVVGVKKTVTTTTEVITDPDVIVCE
jgi:hypothetical protein